MRQGRIHLTGFREQLPSSLAHECVTEEEQQNFLSKERARESIPHSHPR